MDLLPIQDPSVHVDPAGPEQTSSQRLDVEVVWGLLGGNGSLDGDWVLDEGVVGQRESNL